MDNFDEDPTSSSGNNGLHSKVTKGVDILSPTSSVEVGSAVDTTMGG